MSTGEVLLATHALPVSEAASSRTVLFDFDGVLSHGDSFTLFMRQRYRSPLRKLLLLPALPWLLLVAPFSRAQMMRTLVHIGLLGMSAARYESEAKAFGIWLSRRPRQFIRDGLQALRRHQAAGDRVIVVTGCEHTVVAEILQQLGLRDVEVLASTFRPGWFGMRVQRHTIGKGKPAALAEHGVARWARAYGDSAFDIPMLAKADEPVLVNGTPKLCKRVEKALGRSVTRVAWY